jgi:surface polysaccharide O-acyltransferase-like enzyme
MDKNIAATQLDKKTRLPQYDLIRAVAMFLVVYVHSSLNFTFGAEPSKSAGLFWFSSAIALMCNPLFFMVSGKFNIAQAEKLKWGGVLQWYLKKVIDLLLPVIFYAIVFWLMQYVAVKFFGAWSNGSENFFDIYGFLKMVNDLLCSSWWFVPAIFALMIVTPFIARLMKNLNKSETLLWFGIIFGLPAIVLIDKLLPFDSTAISKFATAVFAGSVGIYAWGYFIDKLKFTKQRRRALYLLTLSIIVVVGVISVLAPLFQTPSLGNPDLLLSIFFPITAGAIFISLKNLKIVGEKTRKIVGFIGQRAYGIYLIHFVFYLSFLQVLPDAFREASSAPEAIAKRFLISTIVYILSLVLASLIDLLIVRPIQKKIKSKVLS